MKPPTNRISKKVKLWLMIWISIVIVTGWKWSSSLNREIVLENLPFLTNPRDLLL